MPAVVPFIPAIIGLIGGGASMVEANQTAEAQKGQQATLNKTLADQAALANAAPPAVTPPAPGSINDPSNPGSAGRAGTILTGPTDLSSYGAPPPKRPPLTLLGL